MDVAVRRFPTTGYIELIIITTNNKMRELLKAAGTVLALLLMIGVLGLLINITIDITYLLFNNYRVVVIVTIVFWAFVLFTPLVYFRNKKNEIQD